MLLDLKPAGTNFMEDFHAGGGLPALWRRLKDHLDLNAKSVNAETIGEVIARWPAYVNDEIVRPLQQSAGEKRSHCGPHRQPRAARRCDQARGRDARLFPHEGPALVFDSLDDLEKRIDDPNLNVTPDTVMVLRNAGPIGAPGMPEGRRTANPEEARLERLKDIVRLSDARMSGTAFGTVVLHVSPEAAAAVRWRSFATATASSSTPRAAGSISKSTTPSSQAPHSNGSRRRSPSADTCGSTPSG